MKRGEARIWREKQEVVRRRLLSATYSPFPVEEQVLEEPMRGSILSNRYATGRASGKPIGIFIL